MLKNCGFGTQWLPLVDWVKHCWIFENLIVTVNISDATVTKLLTNSMQDLKMNNLETKKCNNFVFWVLVSVFKCVLKLPAWEPCIFLVCHLQSCCSWQGTIVARSVKISTNNLFYNISKFATNQRKCLK